MIGTTTRLGALALVTSLSLACGAGGGPGPAPVTPVEPPAPVLVPVVGPSDVTTGGPFLLQPLPLFTSPSGWGFDLVSGEARGQCLLGEVVGAPVDEVTRRLERPFSRDELDWILGHRLGTAERVQQDLRVMMARNPLSVVLAYGATRTVRRDRIDLARPTWIVDPAADDFLPRCGDALVAGQDQGGFYAVVFTFHFEDQEALDAFEAKVGRAVAVWDLFPRIAQNAALLRGRTVFSGYSVLQRGGELRMGIPGVAAEELWTCGLYQGLSSCAAVADGVVRFVTAADAGGFLAGVARQPSPLGNTLRPWSEVSAAPPPRVTPPGVALARDRLHGLHEAQLARAERLAVAPRFPGLVPPPSELRALEQSVAMNEVVARSSLQRCYRSEVAAPGAAQDDCILGAMDEWLRTHRFDPTLSLVPLGVP